jgi:hypothetical protein
MRFWSEGLGDRQLVMNLSKAHIKRQDELMLLSGVVDSPAPWEYEVKIHRDDWAKILETAATKEACTFIATHTTFVQLLAMAWSIVVFVALLAWFRVMYLLGLQGAREASIPSGQPVSATPTGLKRQ